MNLQIREFSKSEKDYKKHLFVENKISQLDAQHWSEDLKTQITNMQYMAQENHINTYFPEAKDSVIICNNKKVGRLVFEKSDFKLHVIDIVIEKKHQNKGLGTEILTKLISENELISLNVDMNNPALNLYQRLGFKVIEQRNHQYFMEYEKQSPWY